jgi:hypothetical protein
MDGPLKDCLYPEKAPFKKQIARGLIVQGKQMLRGDSSCLVALVDTHCLSEVSELMTKYAQLSLHHDVVVASVGRKTKQGDKGIDRRGKAYFEVHLSNPSTNGISMCT